jgi:hypothetical protein
MCAQAKVVADFIECVVGLGNAVLPFVEANNIVTNSPFSNLGWKKQFDMLRLVYVVVSIRSTCAKD